MPNAGRSQPVSTPSLWFGRSFSNAHANQRPASQSFANQYLTPSDTAKNPSGRLSRPVVFCDTRVPPRLPPGIRARTSWRGAALPCGSSIVWLASGSRERLQVCSSPRFGAAALQRSCLQKVKISKGGRASSRAANRCIVRITKRSIWYSSVYPITKDRRDAIPPLNLSPYRTTASFTESFCGISFNS
jgi:hypothetical protein